MADLWWEDGTRVTTPDGREGRLRVTRRERKLVAEGKLHTAYVLGTDGLQRKHDVADLVEVIKEEPAAMVCEHGHYTCKQCKWIGGYPLEWIFDSK